MLLRSFGPRHFLLRRTTVTISKDVFDYAWNWFEYHAAQRLLAFRFFLIFIGIIAVALNNAVKVSNFEIVQIIGGLGAFISLAFLALEIRNEQLVNVGRDALKVIENDAAYPVNEELKLLSIDRHRNPIYSHKLWLRLIYAVCILGFGMISICPKTLF